MQEIKCRIAPSLGGGFAGTPEQVWGTAPYNPETDIDKPCVFFGIYGLPDFYALWRHKGKKWILWAGSDIQHLINGYWLDDSEWGAKLPPESLADWINRNCESWVENENEREDLATVGIEAQVCPSFLGYIDDYPITFTPNDRPQVYASVSGDNFDLYGWNIIEQIADKCDVDFYLYGSANWETKHHNVFIQGRVPKEQMNLEIQSMQCGLRLNDKDGFSEVLAKSVLWGQYPLTWAHFKYPFIGAFNNKVSLIKELNQLKNKTQPNIEARNHYQRNLNRYPWIKK
mgnify:FL=1